MPAAPPMKYRIRIYGNRYVLANRWHDFGEIFFSGVNMKVVAVHVSINGLRFELKNYQFSNVCEIFRLIIKG